MGISKEQVRILALSKNEQVLLKILEDGPFRVNELTYKSRLPRMTVYSVLNSLMKRGLVTKTQFKRTWRYTLIDAQAFSGFATEANEYNSVRGADAIARLYLKMFRLHAGERVRAIQGAQSWGQAVRKIKLDILNTINKEIKDNQIILEAVVSSSILDLSKVQSTAWKKSMEGRTTGVTVVSDALLDFNSEVWIFSDVVLIADWKKEVCRILKGSDTVRLFDTLFMPLQSLGRRFDSNAFLRAHG